MPEHAKIADKLTILRSLSHDAGGHSNGPQRLLTGHFSPTERELPEHPDCLAVANYLRRKRGREIINYIGLTTSETDTPIYSVGPAYLGQTYAPFMVFNDVQKPDYKIGLDLGRAGAQLPLRRGLLANIDRSRGTEAEETMDEFQQQALDLYVGGHARRAFDLEQEPAAIRDRYGRTGWGQQCLLARRLVEAGVDLVTVTLSGPETFSRPKNGDGNWDDHAVNTHIFQSLKARIGNFDRCVAGLIEDLCDRGLDQRVLVIVAGEFGRTPRITYGNRQYTGMRQPGRDHWPYAMSILFAGGGIAGGQVVGATNRNGEHPIERPVRVQDFLATIYRHLGIDYFNAQVPHSTGRPMPILASGQPIAELTART
ncbi:MAG: DUF1501 domain-containing protein [Pirellulales bacterium]